MHVVMLLDASLAQLVTSRLTAIGARSNSAWLVEDDNRLGNFARTDNSLSIGARWPHFFACLSRSADADAHDVRTRKSAFRPMAMAVINDIYTFLCFQIN